MAVMQTIRRKKKKKKNELRDVNIENAAGYFNRAAAFSYLEYRSGGHTRFCLG